MRAALLASATATTSGGRRRRNPITHGSALVAFERSKYWLPRLDIPPRQARFAAGGILPWHQTQPVRELAPTAEAARFYYRGGDGCRVRISARPFERRALA